MDDVEFDQKVKPFLARHIDSVVQLEVLLLLARSPGRAFTADDVARELRIEPTWTEGQLAQLASRHLLEKSAAGNAYRYEPTDPALREGVAALARAYADRRVSVISLIYSQPPAPAPADPLKSFSDAFRIRKGNDHG